MAVWSWSMPGTNEDAREVRDRLNEIGAVCGYSARRSETKRGPLAQGAGGYVIRALAEGKAAVLPVESVYDRAWLAEQLLRLAEAHPERAEALRQAVEALRLADEMHTRGQIGPVGV
jgi:hypothetical protein